MTAFWRSLGNKRYYLDAEDVATDAWYTANRPRTQNSAGARSVALWRLGDSALMRQTAGLVIRGVTMTLRLRGVVAGDVPANVYVLPGCLATPLARALPDDAGRNRAGWVAVGATSLRTTVSVAASTAPLGVMPSVEQFSDYPYDAVPVGAPGSPAWDGSTLLAPFWPGVTSDWVASAVRVSTPGETAIATYPEIENFEILVSEKPEWWITFNNAQFDIGVERPLYVYVRYRDNEAVTGLGVNLRSQNGCFSIKSGIAGGAFNTAARSTTDNVGVAVFTVKAIAAGNDFLHFDLDSGMEWLGANCYDPPFPDQIPLSVRGAPQPPLPGVCTTYPAVPGVPGVPARIEVTNDTSWNSGANSVVEVSGNAQLEFQQPHAHGAVVGLVDARDGVGQYERTTHGFYFHFNASGSPVYQVIESGRTMTAEVAHSATALFRIQRVGGVVSYFVNNARVYRSAVRSTATVMVGCSLYASNDRVTAENLDSDDCFWTDIVFATQECGADEPPPMTGYSLIDIGMFVEHITYLDDVGPVASTFSEVIVGFDEFEGQTSWWNINDGYVNSPALASSGPLVVGVSRTDDNTHFKTFSTADGVSLTHYENVFAMDELSSNVYSVVYHKARAKFYAIVTSNGSPYRTKVYEMGATPATWTHVYSTGAYAYAHGAVYIDATSEFIFVENSSPTNKFHVLGATGGFVERVPDLSAVDYLDVDLGSRTCNVSYLATAELYVVAARSGGTQGYATAPALDGVFTFVEPPRSDGAPQQGILEIPSIDGVAVAFGDTCDSENPTGIDVLTNLNATNAVLQSDEDIWYNGTYVTLRLFVPGALPNTGKFYGNIVSGCG